MTELVEKAVAILRRLPQTDQELMARAILSLADRGNRLDIEAEHLPYVLEGLAQLERGEYATDAEVDEAFRSFEA